MADGIMISIGDDGVAKLYDDTYDITIHCESKEEQDEVVKKLQSLRWIPCDEALPTENKMIEYVLCTTTYGTVEICKFGSWWWEGSESHFWNDTGMLVDEYVSAWMPLPDPWKGESDEAD